MSNRFERLITRRLKRIARAPGLGFIPIALLLFFAADSLIAQSVRRRIAESPFRFAQSSIALVEEITLQAADSPSPRALFFGDSVVRGARLAAGETLPVFFEKKLVTQTGRPWTVFNLGLTAANNSDKLLLLQRMIDGDCRPDLVVIADNMKFYSRQYPVQTARYPKLATAAVRKKHPRLVYRILSLKYPPRKVLWAEPDNIADRLAERVFLVRNRDFIAGLIGVGDHPFRRGLTAMNHIKHRLAGQSEEAADKKGYRRSYDLPKLNLRPETGVNMRALVEIRNMCDAHNLSCFFYLTPINVARAYREKIFTQQTLNRYRNAVSDVLGLDPERNADLTTLLDEGDFHDMDHPTLNGMQKLAAELARRTQELAGATP
jgi:hypothetical protein